MKRLLFAVLLSIAGAAHAFDPTPAGPSIGVLHRQDLSMIERAFHDELFSELRERGFEVFEVEATLDELSRDPDRDADWYVEVIPARGETVDYGGVGVGGRHADVTLGLLVSRMAAEANVYRGRTLELIATESLKKKNTALVPTSLGFGGRSLFAAIALPFVERAQARGVARSAARDLASRVTNVVRTQ
jgi:hypothetical protein